MTELDLLPATEGDTSDARRFRGDRLIVTFLGLVVVLAVAGGLVLAELDTPVPEKVYELAIAALGGLLVMARAGSST